jgi:hypothetical protein
MPNVNNEICNREQGPDRKIIQWSYGLCISRPAVMPIRLNSGYRMISQNGDIRVHRYWVVEIQNYLK